WCGMKTARCSKTSRKPPRGRASPHASRTERLKPGSRKSKKIEPDKNQKQNLKHGGNGGRKSEGTEEFLKGFGLYQEASPSAENTTEPTNSIIFRIPPFPQIFSLRFLRVSGLFLILARPNPAVHVPPIPRP